MTENTSPIKLDVEQIIRRARLRSCRETDAAMMSLLLQELHRRDPETRLRFRIMSDEGRSTVEQLFAVEYQGDLWTVKGKGDWDRQMSLALARNSQTWKNPVLRSIPPSEEEGLHCALLQEKFPLSVKLQHRIAEATSFVEAQGLGVATPPSAPQPRRSPRL